MLATFFFANFNELFDLLNVYSLEEGVHERKSNKAQYHSPDDERLKVVYNCNNLQYISCLFVVVFCKIYLYFCSCLKMSFYNTRRIERIIGLKKRFTGITTNQTLPKS